MKIFAAGVATETNTFSPLPTGRDDFVVQRGKDDRAARAHDANLDLPEIWGTLASERGAEFVFSLMAFAQPSGITVRSALRGATGRDAQRPQGGDARGRGPTNVARRDGGGKI